MEDSAEFTSTTPRVGSFGKVCAWSLIALGGLVITGWAFDIDSLKSILPGFISMKVNTAIGFALAGVSLLLLLRRDGGDAKVRPYVILFAALVFLIGFLNLIQYIFGVDLRIDQLLVHDSSPGPYPGRLAPVTAVDFTVCGIGLVLLACSRGIVLAQLLALLAAFSAFLAIIGYAFGVPLLYGSVRYTSMALHTGVGCVLLAAGLLAARPQSGIMAVLVTRGPGGWMARRLLPAMLLLPPLLGFVFLQLNVFFVDARLTVALIIVTLVALFLAIIWVLAQVLNDSEYQLRRAQAEVATGQEALSRSEALLRQSQKMDAIGQLSAGIAHDFNNLLAVIIGYCELLLFGSQLTPADRAKVQRISVAGDTAAALTRQLLAFSRQQLIQPTQLNLNDVITHFEVVLRRLLKEDVQMMISLQPDLGLVLADKGQMEQLVMNLAVNASDAMPDGGKLFIETREIHLSDDTAQDLKLPPGPYARLTVTDSGAGIPPDVQARIFEPFFTTKPVGKGTGLGLATVFGIVQQNRGGISVSSPPGKGASFAIFLPIVEAVAAAPGEAPPAPLPKTRARILVVEDSEAIAELVTETLQANGYEVLVSTNGLDALDLCRALDRPVDLVLTDVIMPEMSGRVMVEHLQKLWPTVKIIFMSGYTSDVIVRHGVFNSDVGFIEKPFTPSQLVQKVSETLAFA